MSETITNKELHTALHERCAACPSRFHQLLMAAAFWNPGLGLYADPESGTVLSRDDSDVIRGLHSRLFSEWLCLSLADQFAELAGYVTTLSLTGRTIFLELLHHSRACDPLVPPTASAEAKALFFSDLRAVAAMITAD